ncbi:MAG: tripartite tricarboxylate transporter TctB family protein [Pseudomonadota bacterium]
MRIRSQRDFVCGLIFIGIGIVVMVIATDYRLGTAARMGPGYFPMLLGGLMALLGLTLTVPALFIDGARLPAMALRPFLIVLASIGTFGLALQYLGFVVAVLMLVLVAGFADPDLRLRESAALAVFMAVFSAGVFWMLLGLPLTLWPSF